jgi:hypothetical protein
MNQPSPLRRAPTTTAERQIALAAEVAPRPLDLGGWDEVVARAALEATPPRGRLFAAFAASVALGAALVVAFRPAPAPAPEPAQLVVTAGAQWSQPAPSVVALRAGRVQVTGGESLRIETPDAVLVASRARFLAEVTSRGTLVFVEEGEVTLRAGEMERLVRAGEAVTWPPAPEVPQHLRAPAGPSASGCAGPVAARRACLRTQAAGDSLEAEAALYELAALERDAGDSPAAIATWQESLARFPAGVLHPEVRLSLLVEFIEQRRFAEAAAAARDFEAHCPNDPRAAAVAELRRALPQSY